MSMRRLIVMTPRVFSRGSADFGPSSQGPRPWLRLLTDRWPLRFVVPPCALCAKTLCKWQWLTRRKHNRRVNPDRARNRPVGDWDIATTGTVVHLENYGMLEVFRIISKDGTAGQ